MDSEKYRLKKFSVGDVVFFKRDASKQPMEVKGYQTEGADSEGEPISVLWNNSTKRWSAYAESELDLFRPVE